MKLLLPIAAMVSLISPIAYAEDTPQVEQPAEEVKVKRGTRLYDAASVQELFIEYKKRNEAEAAAAASDYDYEDMELIELKSIEVNANHINNERALMNQLDPRPENRIRRLARVNPDAAYDLQTAARNDEYFFSPTADSRDANTGTSANLSVTQMADALEATFNKIGQLFGGKKKTGDGR
ncbi:hypothetical protein MLD52_06240 [Puniceicoccaceae bacterium K14]|nr:hypothetical protein [Puniceicoccaceae bacterium K14]